MAQKFTLLFCLLIALASCRPALLTVQETARRTTQPGSAPKYSDVCFSSRWERPRNEQDTLETFSSARSFHATYLNWVYTTNPDFIKKADSLGYRMQVALTPTLPDLPFGSNENKIGRIVNKAGQPVTAPWMKGWNNWWGCVNNPAFQEIYFAYIEEALKAGAYGFQVDDPAMGFLLLRNKWEDVCYCAFCRKKADSLGVQPPDIQEVSVKSFHQTMKKRAEELAGRPVPFSCNNFEGDWELSPYGEFDFGVAEIPERRANPEYLYAAIREARRNEKAQVFTFANDRDWLVQKMIAATYACGGNMLVPWDVWQGGGKDRYFGKPEQFAPLYGFVGAVAPWLDGYEDAFYATSQDDVRFIEDRNLPVSFEEYRRQIHAFVRAKPGDADAPVVVHLIDWHVLMEPFGIRLNEGRFFKKGIASVELLTPVPFDKTQHEAAEASGDFSALFASQTIDFQRDGKLLHLKIPKLEQHWGLLILRKK
ncbi:MAG: hypothetical protein HY842_08865 [Bacteroidetes bacterium]|nr:hypothetical protein [Bacteroidota bacterium]